MPETYSLPWSAAAVVLGLVLVIGPARLVRWWRRRRLPTDAEALRREASRHARAFRRTRRKEGAPC